MGAASQRQQSPPTHYAHKRANRQYLTIMIEVHVLLYVYKEMISVQCYYCRVVNEMLASKCVIRRLYSIVTHCISPFELAGAIFPVYVVHCVPYEYA